MATLYTCDTESMNSVFTQYYDTLLKMLDDILERGSCHGYFVDEIDGKPVKVAKYFGQDKCRFDHWRTFDRSVWELIRRYGSYYVKATKDE